MSRWRVLWQRIIPSPSNRGFALPSAAKRSLRTRPTWSGGASAIDVWGRTRLAAFWTVLACAAPSTFAGTAHAAPQVFVALEYQVVPGAPGCADVSAFQAAVRNQLGYDPFRPTAERQVAVQIARSDTGYEGRIQWTAAGRAAGDRHLSTAHRECGEIVNNLAFALAVQIQLQAALAPVTPPLTAAPRASPTSAPQPSTPLPPGASSRPVTPPVEVPPPPVSPAPPRAAHLLRLAVGFGPSLALALAPGPTATGRLFVNARLTRLSFELALDGAWPARRREPAGDGFSLNRFGAEGAVCGHVSAFAACATGALGLLEARGFGVDAPRTATGLTAQLGARLVAAHDLGPRLFVAARVEGMLMPYRWTVTLNDTATWTTPRVAAVLGADLGVRIFR